MEDGQELGPEVLGRADEHIAVSNSQRKFEIAWMQVRMGWQSVKRTRLDPEKKDAIASIIRHYRETGESAINQQLEEYRQGISDFGGVSALSRELVLTELELAKSREERITILEASLNAFKETEQFAEEKFGIGAATSKDLLLAKAERIKAEIALHKDRKGR